MPTDVSLSGGKDGLATQLGKSAETSFQVHLAAVADVDQQDV